MSGFSRTGDDRPPISYSLCVQRVADLVNASEYGQALVRLWMLAGTRSGENSLLNSWERSREPAPGFTESVRRFAISLQNERELTLAEIAAAPLAFVTALDEACWLLHSAHPPSGQPYDEEGNDYWLTRIETSTRRAVPLARHTGNREAWFKWHTIIPARTSHGIEVAVTAATGRVAESLRALVDQRSVILRAWIGHFMDRAILKWEPSPNGRFRLLSIEPSEARLVAIRDSLRKAAESGARVVVLPEFTVDLTGRKVVAEWLRTTPEHPFCLVVPGSFHESTDSGVFNTAELWSHLGEALLVHRKMRLYGQAEGLAEDAGEGNQLSVLLTPIGTFTLLICKDFMDDYARVATLLQEVPVDWVLVPSYGDEKTLRGHKDRATNLAKVGPGTNSVVANQRAVELQAGEPLPGFAMQAPGATYFPADPSGAVVRLVVNCHDEPPTRSDGLKLVK